MNNVIPLKRSEHLLPDDEFEALVAELNHVATRYAGFMSLPAAIRKTLSDALKRDKRDGDTERGPEAS